MSQDNLSVCRAANLKTVRLFLESLMAKDFVRFESLLTDDITQESPFRPQGFPAAFTGKAEVMHHYVEAMRTRKGLKFEIQADYPCVDPDIVIVEFTGRSEVIETGKIYSQRYLAIFWFRDGKIRLFREYFNPLVLEQAFGGIEGLTDIMKL